MVGINRYIVGQLEKVHRLEDSQPLADSGNPKSLESFRVNYA